MGRNNALAVYDLWRHLPERPRAVLVYMALISLDYDSDRDDTDARVYFGGHVQIANALGLNSDLEMPTPGHLRMVRRYIDQLRAAGAVVRVQRAKNHRHAIYRLRLEPVDKPPPEPP
ncbi:hypothetical protein [Pseudactinotalea terrae]|uniref:hypothetical protein n=1 Tax=Pseudactinotalea terrae TaxID=1743262 RepID=UPI0012E0F8A4|nr:hypothetical protein [Pseudactinotalea terrae]